MISTAMRQSVVPSGDHYCIDIVVIIAAMRQCSRTPLIRPPSESSWCGRIRGMVAREGFVYEQKPLSVTRNVVV